MAIATFQCDQLGHGSIVDLCPLPDDKTVCTTSLDAGGCKQLVFGLAAGNELSDHQTPNTAVIHLVHGDATVRVGDEFFELEPGGVVVIPPRITHSVHANQPTRFMLTLIKVSTDE